jgi:hypothetical protein
VPVSNSVSEFLGNCTNLSTVIDMLNIEFVYHSDTKISPEAQDFKGWAMWSLFMCSREVGTESECVRNILLDRTQGLKVLSQDVDRPLADQWHYYSAHYMRSKLITCFLSIFHSKIINLWHNIMHCNNELKEADIDWPTSHSWYTQPGNTDPLY